MTYMLVRIPEIEKKKEYKDLQASKKSNHEQTMRGDSFYECRWRIK